MPTILKRPGKTRRGSQELRAMIFRREPIHSGSEGAVHRADIHVTSGNRSRIRPVKLVEKKFHGAEETRRTVSYQVYKENPLLAKPVEQFELVTRIRRINTRLRLGLRFPHTIRLVKHDDGKYSILSTQLNVVNPYELSPKQEDAYFRDVERQQDILKRLRIRALKDVFFCVQDPATKEVTAVIADFGTLAPIKKQK